MTTTTDLPKLTASRLRDAKACQRLHHYKYGLGYRPLAEGTALRFGKLVHDGLEAWWEGAGEERLDAALAAIAQPEADPFDQAKAEAMLRGYHARWCDQQFRVVGVEVPFETELVNPDTGKPSRTWTLAGKIDAIVEVDGKCMIVEHKTTSEDMSAGSAYWARLRLDQQISIYYAGAASLGLKVDGAIYDVLGKPGQKPLKTNSRRQVDESPLEYRDRVIEAIAEEPNAYFARAEVVRLEAEMSEGMADVWQLGRMLRENDARGFHPRTVEACTRFGTCPFFAVCCGEASLDDTNKFRRLTELHPELASAA